jgi:hypothetical protein
MTDIAFKVISHGEALAVFAVADSLNIPVYEGTRNAYRDDFEREVRTFKYIVYGGKHITSAKTANRYDVITFGEFISHLSIENNIRVELNDRYSVTIRRGSLHLDERTIDISIVEAMLAMVGGGGTIQDKDAVIVTNRKQFEVITRIASQYGIEADTLEGAEDYKEIIFRTGSGTTYLAANKVKTGKFNYKSFEDFLTSMVTENPTSMSVEGYNTTYENNGKYFNVGCQRIDLDKVQEVKDKYYEVNPS